MTEKHFIVTVTVLEGRHYIWKDMSSAVIVNIDNKKKCTDIVRDTDCPFYNEYFVFEFYTTEEKFIEKYLTITVIQPKCFFRKRKILGNIKLDIATILKQKDCQFYHKWAALCSPKLEVYSGPTGYLKLDICVLSKGQSAKLPLGVVNDNIEGEKQQAQYIFEIYNIKNLQKKSNEFIYDKSGSAQSDYQPSTFVEITFAGSSVKTGIQKNNSNPVFNERLVLTDMFPPLCQRFRIDIRNDDFKKSIHSTHFLNLDNISSDTVE
ncbi:otoferlin-like, partial [Sitophilus oryzae]|uniref:Otoferlin-like n=1 Tax=Sitophilus oryzae TaxID=7048 RepID=A0A6J2XRS2_SITOR